MGEETTDYSNLNIKFTQCLYCTKVFIHGENPSEQQLNTALNELGPQGWELVSVTQAPLQTRYWLDGQVRDLQYQTIMYFKLPWPSELPRIPVPESENINE